MRGFGSLVAIVAVAVTAPALASAREHGFRKGPYLQNVSERSVTIMWQSDQAEAGQVRLLDKSGTHVVRTIASEADEIHEVVIDKLEPGHRYRYQVESEGETEGGEFATAPEADAPFSFVVFGDTREYESAHLRVVERVRREVPDFILATGDMVNKGASEEQWQTFFEVERDLLRENVMYPSLGNHDRQGAGRTADSYRKYFSLPENSPDPERYYAFTYGNSRFLILDSNAYAFALTDQTAWIEQQLQEANLDPKIEHIFVSMHHPPFSISLHGGRTELRDAWTPLYEKYGVTAVFSGHDHCYERAEHNGIHYFVAGGGGAPLYPRARKPSKIDLEAVKYFERTNHYLRVMVTGDLIEVTAIRADGSIMETTTWGAAPRPREALAGLQVGGPPAPADDDAAAAHGNADQNGQIREATAAVHGGFGTLGFAGLGIALLGGLALIWSLRR